MSKPLNINMSKQLNIVGKPGRSVDSMKKASGQTIYAGDLVLPRMLHCKLLRSIHPHARIKQIDTSEAEAMNGVIAVMVGSEQPNKFGILPVSEDEESLAIDKVRFVGDPVAAVAAIDEEDVKDTLDSITHEDRGTDFRFHAGKEAS